MRLLLLVFLLLSTVIVLVALFGPREPFRGEVSFDSNRLGHDLDEYLSNSEKQFSDIREGLRKQIVWADPAIREKTELAFIYIHGFSASLAEVRPVPDRVAAAFGANLFYTRLKGHARTADSMGEAVADDWLNDVAEAIAIGSRLGRRVIVISTSTGAALTTWLAANDGTLDKRLSGHIMISPNFGLADPLSFILKWPYARQFVPLVLGKYRGQRSQDAAVNHAWTTPHATEALMPMALIASKAAAASHGKISAPAFFIYSPNDKTVNPRSTESVISRWGGGGDVLQIEQSEDENNHVIVGDIISPKTTEEVVSAIVTWLKTRIQ